MSARKVRRVIRPPLAAHQLDGTKAPEKTSSQIVEEWEPEPPRDGWSDWQRLGEEVDEDPTYYAEHNPDGGLFRAPTLHSLSPRRRRTVTYQRRLIRRWVDAEHGPMAQVVDVETRTMRS